MEGAPVLDRNDAIPVAPDDHGGQFGCQMQAIEGTHRLPVIVDHRAQRAQECLAGLPIGQR